jgi:segregation and condensation protein B
VRRLAEATEQPEPAVLAALGQLKDRLQKGLRLSEHDGHYQLMSAPDTSAVVRRFLELETKTELSQPALETLAVVAYRGPITKSQIEAVRGVAVDTVLRNLLTRGLITEAGKSPEPGRPLRYAVSHRFLHHFGLTSLADLPPLPATEGPQHAD